MCRTQMKPAPNHDRYRKDRQEGSRVCVETEHPTKSRRKKLIPFHDSSIPAPVSHASRASSRPQKLGQNRHTQEHTSIITTHEQEQEQSTHRSRTNRSTTRKHRQVHSQTREANNAHKDASSPSDFYNNDGPRFSHWQ